MKKAIKTIAVIAMVCVMVMSITVAVTACGDNSEIKEATGLEYEMVYREDGSTYYYVSGIGTETLKEFKIPAVYNGKAVIGIDDRAFKGSSVVRVEFPATVTSIGNNAFENCADLKAIVASGVTAIWGDAFLGCEALESVALASGNWEISYARGSVGYITYDKESLELSDPAAAATTLKALSGYYNILCEEAA